jgi:hypothetical protein
MPSESRWCGIILWRLCLLTHDWLDYPWFFWFWRIWWFVGYKYVYPFMWRKKAEGAIFAQPFGEGEDGIRRFLATPYCLSF